MCLMTLIGRKRKKQHLISNGQVFYNIDFQKKKKKKERFPGSERCTNSKKNKSKENQA